jgi:hypothetical protein
MSRCYSLFWIVVIIASACVAGSEVTQSFSPLPPGTTARLSGNRWVVVELTLQGEAIPFDALTPLYIWFDPAGALNFSSPHCAGGAFLIFFEDEHHYRLGRGGFAAVDCGEVRNRQRSRVIDALRATTSYELHDRQLWLTGENAHMILEPIPIEAVVFQPESPLIPGSNTVLAEHRWRVVEIIYAGQIVVFDAIQPIYITFDNPGYLTKYTTNCNSGGYHLIAESINRYRLIPGSGTAKDCGEIGNQQYDLVSEAIGATTDLELQGDQLFLTGPEARIVLEIDTSQ